MSRAIEGLKVGRMISSASFDERGITVEYLDAGDCKANGLVMVKTVFIPHAGQYDDEIDAVTDALNALLDDVLVDFPALQVKDFTSDDDDDDDDEGDQ